MILNNKQISVLSEGEELESSKMEIDSDPESLLFLMQSISNLYSDPVGSCIREYCSNALDSHVDAGTNSPIMVNLYRENYNWFFSVEDKGLGINQETIDNIIRKYGKSTKRTSNAVLGCYGWGSKSAWAYTSHFYIIGRKNGIEGKWLLREGEEGNEIDVIYTKETTEPNGAKVIIPVKASDEHNWSEKIREQLCYFKGVYITDGYRSLNNDFKIFENKLFKYSKLNQDSKLHIALGDVYYPLDFDKLGINPIYIPIALNFGLDDGIEPVPSRENLKLPNETKEKIKIRIREVADWMVNRYNEESKEFETWGEARVLISQRDKHVMLNDVSIKINELLSYASTAASGVKIKGLQDAHLDHLLLRETYIISKLKPSSSISYVGTMTKDNNWYRLNFNDNCVIVDGAPVGMMRDYLKEVYPKGTRFVTVAPDKKLMERFPNGKIAMYGDRDYKYWYNALELWKFPKDEWRTYIKEAQFIEQEMIKKCKDLRGFVIPEEWKQARKKKQVSLGKYTILDKQEGEVTIGWLRPGSYGGYVSQKQTHKVSDQKKRKGLVIYSNIIDDKGNLGVLKKWLSKISDANKPYSTAIIGPRESSKLEGINQFKTLKWFMEESKLFKKYATAYKAQPILGALSTLTNDTSVEILKVLNGKYSGDFLKVKEYVKKYGVEDIMHTTFGRELAEYAEKNAIFDEEFQPYVNNLLKFCNSISFLKFLKIPANKTSWEDVKQYDAKMKEFLNVIHKYFLFEKLHNGHFEDWTMCPPAKQEEETILETTNTEENEVF